MTIREQNEQREHAVLEPWATFADSSAGRLRPMEPCPYRTCFQRDGTALSIQRRSGGWATRRRYLSRRRVTTTVLG